MNKGRHWYPGRRFPSLTILMDPCAITRSGSRPRSLVNVIVVVIGIVPIGGLVRVVGIIAHHHVFSPGQGWADGNLCLGLVGCAAPARRRTRFGALMVMLAVFAPPDESVRRRRPARLLPLLLRLLPWGRRLVRGVLNDGERWRLHLLLRCAPAPRRLILRALAQNAEDLAIVGPLQCLPESRSRTLSLLRPHIPLRLNSMQNKNQKTHAHRCATRRARYA